MSKWWELWCIGVYIFSCQRIISSCQKTVVQAISIVFIIHASECGSCEAACDGRTVGSEMLSIGHLFVVVASTGDGGVSVVGLR